MAARHRRPNTSWELPAVDRAQPQICATSGKRMYKSEAEAKATAAHQMSKETTPAQLRSYKCLYCGAATLAPARCRTAINAHRLVLDLAFLAR